MSPQTSQLPVGSLLFGTYEITGVLSLAIDAAARDAEASGLQEPVVLLSPACASFDQFRNYEHRGEVFEELVRALPEAGG